MTVPVSLILLAYNQGRFIREAVESALSQTYSPLEIILSDDCSSDRTFAIMQEISAAYTGPHTVRLNRNETNLGFIPHYNTACRLASGRLLVSAAGDDISLPHRVQRIIDEWQRGGQPQQAVFYSTVQRITQNGASYPQEGSGFGSRQVHDPVRLISEWGGFVIGAALAVTRGVLDRFGPINDAMPCEDIPALWRGALCGNLHFINEALVRWRIGGQGLWSCVYDRETTSAQRLETMQRFLRERQTLVTQACKDVQTFGRSQELDLALGRFETETACAIASVNGSAWRFLFRYLRLWVKNGRVSHALRECVVAYIRISKDMGRNRLLWFMTEAVARADGFCKRCFNTGTQRH